MGRTRAIARSAAEDKTASLVPLLVLHDAALLLAVFLAPIFWGGFSAGAQAMIGGLVSVAALSAVAWRGAARHQGPAVVPNAIHLPALLFLALSAVSTLFSTSPHSSYLELSRLAQSTILFALVANRVLLPASPAAWVAGLVGPTAAIICWSTSIPAESGSSLDVFSTLGVGALCAVLVLTRQRPDPVRRLLEAVVLSAALVVSPQGIREKILTLQMDNPSWTIFSTFFNKNELAGFLALALPLALALALGAKARWERLTWGFSGLLVLTALALTSSKGAYVGLAVAMAWFAVMVARLSARPRRNLAIALGVFAVLTMAAAGVVLGSPAVRTRVAGTFGRRSNSNMFRLLTWQGTLRMAAHYPVVGIGPGAFKSAFPNYTVAGYTEAAHENYLQVLAEQGGPGALAFLWLLGAAAFTGWRARRRPGAEHADQLLAAAGLAALTSFLLHSLFDFTWYIGAVNLTLLLLLGAMAHLAHGYTWAEVTPPPAIAPTTAKGRRRAGTPPAPVVAPAAEPPVHAFRWLAGQAGSVITLLALALVGYGGVSVAARNALAAKAVAEADQFTLQAMEASRRGDKQNFVRFRDAMLESYVNAVLCDPEWSLPKEKAGLALGAEYADARELHSSQLGHVNGEDLLREAIRLEPMSFLPRNSLASLYVSQRRWPDAVKAYQEALAHFPENTRALRGLARAYRESGDEAKALRTYQQIADQESHPINRYAAIDLEIDANYGYAHYELGRAALKAERLAEAERRFRQALTTYTEYFRPNGPAALDKMRQSAGQAAPDRSGDITELAAKSHWRLGGIYDRQGKPAEGSVERSAALALRTDVAQVVAEEDAEVRK